MSSPIRSICGSLRKQVDVNGNTINITGSGRFVAYPSITTEQQPDSNRQSDRLIRAAMPVSIPRNRPWSGRHAGLLLENVRTPSKITSSGLRSRVLCWRPVGGSDLNVVAKFAKLFG